MNAQSQILERLLQGTKQFTYFWWPKFEWKDCDLLRRCALRVKRGDESGWHEFINHLAKHRDLVIATRCILLEIEWGVQRPPFKNEEKAERELFELGWYETSPPDGRFELTLPSNIPLIPYAAREELEAVLNPSEHSTVTVNELPKRKRPGQIKFLELKFGEGLAVIGRVSSSASGRTIYFEWFQLKATKSGIQGNYFDSKSGVEFWVSNPKRCGRDLMRPGTIYIMNDAREEYWNDIRRQPENVHLYKFRSKGKYAKR